MPYGNPKEKIICRDCGNSVQRKNFIRHKRLFCHTPCSDVVPQATTSGTPAISTTNDTCALCNTSVAYGTIKEHLLVQHPVPDAVASATTVSSRNDIVPQEVMAGIPSSATSFTSDCPGASSSEAVYPLLDDALDWCMPDPPNREIKKATVGILRQLNAYSRSGLEEYLSKYFPMIPRYLHATIITATTTAARHVAGKFHLYDAGCGASDPIVADEAKIARTCIARWGAGLRIPEPVTPPRAATQLRSHPQPLVTPTTTLSHFDRTSGIASGVNNLIDTMTQATDLNTSTLLLNIPSALSVPTPVLNASSSLNAQTPVLRAPSTDLDTSSSLNTPTLVLNVPSALSVPTPVLNTSSSLSALLSMSAPSLLNAPSTDLSASSAQNVPSVTKTPTPVLSAPSILNTAVALGAPTALKTPTPPLNSSTLQVPATVSNTPALQSSVAQLPNILESLSTGVSSGVCSSDPPSIGQSASCRHVEPNDTPLIVCAPSDASIDDDLFGRRDGSFSMTPVDDSLGHHRRGPSGLNLFSSPDRQRDSYRHHRLEPEDYLPPRPKRPSYPNRQPLRERQDGMSDRWQDEWNPKRFQSDIEPYSPSRPSYRTDGTRCRDRSYTTYSPARRVLSFGVDHFEDSRLYEGRRNYYR